MRSLFHGNPHAFFHWLVPGMQVRILIMGHSGTPASGNKCSPLPLFLAFVP